MLSLLANVICAGSKKQPSKQILKYPNQTGTYGYKAECLIDSWCLFLRLRADLCSVFVCLQLMQQHELLLFRILWCFTLSMTLRNIQVTFQLTQSWLGVYYIYYFLYIVYPTETPAVSRPCSRMVFTAQASFPTRNSDSFRWVQAIKKTEVSGSEGIDVSPSRAGTLSGGQSACRTGLIMQPVRWYQDLF